MRLTIAYSKLKKRNLVLINNATYQRETLSERPIRQPLKHILTDPALAFIWQQWRSQGLPGWAARPPGASN